MTPSKCLQIHRERKRESWGLLNSSSHPRIVTGYETQEEKYNSHVNESDDYSLQGSVTYLTDFYWLWFWILITSSDLRGELLCHLTVTFVMLRIVMVSNEGCHDNDEEFFSKNTFPKTVQPLADSHRPTLKYAHTHKYKTHKQTQRESIKVINWNRDKK